MRPLLIILALSLVLSGSSCKKTCSQDYLYFHFSGFDSTELSKVIIKKYPKGSGFITATTTEEKQLDSLQNAHGYYNTLIPDALAAYDWIIEFPLAGKTYTITNIQYKNEKNPDSGGFPHFGELDACVDGVNYTINGNTSSKPTNFDSTSPQVIDIKK